MFLARLSSGPAHVYSPASTSRADPRKAIPTVSAEDARIHFRQDQRCCAVATPLGLVLSWQSIVLHAGGLHRKDSTGS
jgi:hypothetical protein